MTNIVVECVTHDAMTLKGYFRTMKAKAKTKFRGATQMVSILHLFRAVAEYRAMFPKAKAKAKAKAKTRSESGVMVSVGSIV